MLCLLAISAVLVSSCTSSTHNSGSQTNDTPATAESKETVKSVEEVNSAQSVLDSVYENLAIYNNRIYLNLGARVTLTTENFNRRLLEEQLGLPSGEYTFVIDEDVLALLRRNDAYGGIAFGQSWISNIEVRIRNLETGEESSSMAFLFEMHKSELSDAELNPDSEFASKFTLSSQDDR